MRIELWSESDQDNYALSNVNDEETRRYVELLSNIKVGQDLPLDIVCVHSDISTDLEVLMDTANAAQIDKNGYECKMDADHLEHWENMECIQTLQDRIKELESMQVVLQKGTTTKRSRPRKKQKTSAVDRNRNRNGNHNVNNVEDDDLSLFD